MGEKWGVDWYVYPPIKKIVCGGKEVYFNPFTYNASIRNNIVLPGVNYYYEFTPSPSVLGFRISPSATFTNNIYNYSKPMKAFFT